MTNGSRPAEDVLWEAVVLMLPAFDLIEQLRPALAEEVAKGLVMELNAVDESLFGVLFEVNPVMLEESEDEALARDQRERERHAGAFGALGLGGDPGSQLARLLGVMRRRLGSLLLILDIEAELDPGLGDAVDHLGDAIRAIGRALMVVKTVT